MTIKQPRRPSTPARRRPRVAGEDRRVPAVRVDARVQGGYAGSGAAPEPPGGGATDQDVRVDAADVRLPSSDLEPTKAPADTPAGGAALPEAVEIALRPRRRAGRWLLSLAVVAVSAVAFGAVSTVDRARADAEVADQQAADDAAASAASTAAEDILGYAYTSVAADLAAAQKRMTPAFAKEFASVVPTVKSLAQQRKLVVTAQVRDAAVLECGEDCSPTKVRVLLFVDQSRTGEGKPLDAIAVRTVFTMTEKDGRWLVSDSVSL